jgi:small subunit ribosomal protein S16
MALRIRLTRIGTKMKPYYRIVVADSRSPRDGRLVEQIGTYNPKAEDKDKVVIKEEKLASWLKKGATPSTTVRSLLKAKGVAGVA